MKTVKVRNKKRRRRALKRWMGKSRKKHKLLDEEMDRFISLPNS